jgi:hypothetical protein
MTESAEWQIHALDTTRIVRNADCACGELGRWCLAPLGATEQERETSASQRSPSCRRVSRFRLGSVAPGAAQLGQATPVMLSNCFALRIWRRSPQSLRRRVFMCCGFASSSGENEPVTVPARSESLIMMTRLP